MKTSKIEIYKTVILAVLGYCMVVKHGLFVLRDELRLIMYCMVVKYGLL